MIMTASAENENDSQQLRHAQNVNVLRTD